MIIQLMRGIIKFETELTDEIGILYTQLSKQQQPDILMITCIDSRLMPGLFTQAQPGVFLTHRNVGNMIPRYDSAYDAHEQSTSPPSEIAALEFAVNGLNVKNIIICGHSDCGAMKTFMHPNPHLPWVNHWVYAQACSSSISVELNIDEADTELTTLTKKNILIQLEKLKAYPLIQERLQRGELTLHGWYFDFESKKVLIYHPPNRQFVDLKSTLDYAIAARKEKIVNAIVMDYMKNLPLPETSVEYQSRTNLLSQLCSESLRPIWDMIKHPISDALWRELEGLYPSCEDSLFIAVIEAAATIKLAKSDKKTLLKELERSKGYYEFCHSVPTSFTHTRMIHSLRHSAEAETETETEAETYTR